MSHGNAEKHYLQPRISHFKSASHCNSMLLNKVFKKSLRKEGQEKIKINFKKVIKTSHSEIHHYPLQHRQNVLARDTKPGCQSLQRLSTLDMLPVRHQMKLKRGKSIFESPSSYNARKQNLKGNSYPYLP